MQASTFYSVHLFLLLLILFSSFKYIGYHKVVLYINY